jgi:hypothetical protein
MFKMTQEIYRVLSEDGGLKVFTDETETSSNAWLQFGIKNGGSYRIRFISRDDDNDVAVRIFSLVTIDKEKQDKVLPVINNLNNKYRYVKFILDNDGDVNVEYDYLVKCPDPAVSAKELIIRIVKIVDEAYPELMRAMWA